MGTVNVAFFTAGERGLPVFAGEPLLSENVTSSATSAQSSAAPMRCTVRIATDTTVRVLIGANPTAVAASPRVVADGEFHATIEAGQKVAVIDE